LEHLLGPTGSIILHVFIVILLVKYVVFDTAHKAPEVEVLIMEPDAADLEEFEKELELLEDLPIVEDTITPPEVAMDMEQPPEVDQFAQDEADVDYAALDIMNDMQSPLVMKGLFKGRSASGRKAMLRTYAGKWGEYTENAVVKALDWLKKHQNADGSWGPNKTAMTGLGLLTFLAHGETTSSEKYGETVEKSIKYLVSRQDEKGRFCKTDNQPGPYAHGMAAYAISEAYGLTRIPALKPVMEKSIQVIIDGQQAAGGWNYKYDKGPRRDTSVAGWQVQALKAAYLAGAENRGIKEAMDKAVRDLKSCHNAESGRFGYTDSGWGTDGVNGIGVLCMQLLGHGNDKETRQALMALKGSPCDWAKPASWAMYGWYYITQAKFHHGGSTWAAWNSKFARTLTKNQNDDGSWTAPGAAARVEHGKETNYGPVYATTFAALTLQVYYRFLPTYKPIAVEPVDETDADDVVIEII
jgi:hypothetical protein